MPCSLFLRILPQHAQDRRWRHRSARVQDGFHHLSLSGTLLTLPGSVLFAFCFCSLSFSFLDLGMLRRSLKLPLLALLALSCEKPGLVGCYSSLRLDSGLFQTPVPVHPPPQQGEQ